MYVNDITIYTEVQCTCKSSSIVLSPYFEGYVGPGMLSVAVAGAVFASPPPGSILTALRHVTKPDSGKSGSEGGKFTSSWPTNANKTLIKKVYWGHFNEKWIMFSTHNDYVTAGCVVIITNYTGDRLNFGLAIERARQEGLKVDSITIGEDCALTSSDRSAGRRGLAGTVLLNKVDLYN